MAYFLGARTRNVRVAAIFLALDDERGDERREARLQRRVDGTAQYQREERRPLWERLLKIRKLR